MLVVVTDVYHGDAVGYQYVAFLQLEVEAYTPVVQENIDHPRVIVRAVVNAAFAT